MSSKVIYPLILKYPLLYTLLCKIQYVKSWCSKMDLVSLRNKGYIVKLPSNVDNVVLSRE